MYRYLIIFALLTICWSPTISAEQHPSETTTPLSLKDKFNIAKIIFSNGTSGVTDLAKDKVTNLAAQAKEAIVASVEQTHITVERAKAEYAQQQTQQAQSEIEAMKKKIATLQEEIDRLKLQLKNAQQAAMHVYKSRK